MTDIVIMRMRKLLAEATPGNRFNPKLPTRFLGWAWRVNGPRFELFGDDFTGSLCSIGLVSSGHDAALIVALRNAAPALLDELESLRSDLREALALLRVSQSEAVNGNFFDRLDALLAKHKEEA